MKQKNKSIIAYFLGAIVLAVILFAAAPMIIDHWIIGNAVPSNISNEQWVSFLGSYIGGTIGGIFTVIGVILTIRFYKKQDVNTKHEEEKKHVATFYWYMRSKVSTVCSWYKFLDQVRAENSLQIPQGELLFEGDASLYFSEIHYLSSCLNYTQIRQLDSFYNTLNNLHLARQIAENNIYDKAPLETRKNNFEIMYQITDSLIQELNDGIFSILEEIREFLEINEDTVHDTSQKSNTTD